MLIPSSGTLTQYCSSDRRQDTIASIAFVIARSIPFSLTKNVYYHSAAKWLRLPECKENVELLLLEINNRIQKHHKVLTVPYLLVKRVQNTFGRANLTPSPRLKFNTFSLPPNSWTTYVCLQIVTKIHDIWQNFELYLLGNGNHLRYGAGISQKLTSTTNLSSLAPSFPRCQ